MKKLAVFIVFFFLFLVNIPKTFAQTPTDTPTPTQNTTAPLDDTADPASFTTDPPQIPTDKNSDYYITDFTPSVKVSFPGLTYDDSEIYVCLRNDSCISDSFLRTIDPPKILPLLKAGLNKDEMLSPSSERENGFNNGWLLNHSIGVCGNDNDKLKPEPCGSDDYFHASNIYLITLYIKQGDTFVAIARGGFYVSRGMPTIELTPKEHLVPGTKFTVKISQDKIRPGGKSRNNYEVVLTGPGIGGGALKGNSKNECDWIDANHNPRIFQFPQPNQPGNNHYTNPDPVDLLQKGYTIPGIYTFQINEQNNEGHDDCSGGFRYASIACTIGPDNKENSNKCKKMVADPRKEDAKNFLENNNYYRLMGYAFQFKKDKDYYIPGTKFSTIAGIYNFDKLLRRIILSLIEELEISFKTKLAYFLSHKYGSECYLKKEIFIKNESYLDFKNIIKKNIKQSNSELFVKYHLIKYDGKFPFWVLIEILSFSAISKFFENLNNLDKNHFSKSYYKYDAVFI